MTTTVFCQIRGKLARFVVATGDHAQAIAEVEVELDRTRTQPDGPVLAAIDGGKQ